MIAGLRFENGQFVMVGLPADGRPLLRAYSIASANYEDHLDFLSIKVPDGPLTSRLQHVRPGDIVLVSRKPTGTLVLHDLNPGKRLYLLSTGTGAAPFLSLISDPELYERFEVVVLVHGVRWARETHVGACSASRRSGATSCLGPRCARSCATTRPSPREPHVTPRAPHRRSSSRAR